MENKPKRKPVLLDGARQTGKSFLLEKLFGEYFEQVIRLDFLEQPSLANLFSASLKPDDILENIEIEFNLVLFLCLRLFPTLKDREKTVIC